MSDAIAENIARLRLEIPDGVNLVAVSKFHPIEAIRAAYGAGQRIFGESRADELVAKVDELPDDIQWHFIGHLQTNKAKQVVGRAALIESVDSIRLLELIDRLSSQKGIVTDVLMQVHVAAEDSKYGWTPDDLIAYFSNHRYRDLKATRLRGIMGMGTNTDDTERIEADFGKIAEIYGQIRAIAPQLKDFDIISMGMSDDFPLAIRHGATHIRIGSRIFGDRY